MCQSREYGTDVALFRPSCEGEVHSCQLLIDVWNSPMTSQIGYSRKVRFLLSAQERNDMEREWHEEHIPWKEQTEAFLYQYLPNHLYFHELYLLLNLLQCCTISLMRLKRAARHS